MYLLKTVLVWSLSILLCPTGLVAEEIPLIKMGGVYRLPVEVNGVITLNFVLDTGASEVNIPADVALTLYRTGTIRDTDFLSGKTYILADGSMLKSSRFLLQSLKVGNQRITNVPASIGTVSSPLLLGQSFLEKLGTWSMDSQRRVLVLRSAPPRNVAPRGKKEQDISLDTIDQPIQQKQEYRPGTARKIYSVTGTVYYTSIGNKLGMILLKTDSSILDLITGREKKRSKFPEWRIGTVWRIHYYKDNDEGEFNIIDRATFTGEINSSIQEAHKIVEKYYEMLAHRLYSEAYELLSPQKKSHTNIEDILHNADTFYSPYDVMFRSNCTDIKISTHNKEKVIIKADIGCLKKSGYAFHKNNDNYYQCDLVNINGKWYIDHIKNITFEQF